MDNKGKASAVMILAIAICIGIVGYIAYDWWQKTTSASGSAPIAPGGPNAPHGTVGIDFMAQKMDGSWIGLTWDSPTNPGTFSIYANPATLSLWTGNGIQIQKFVYRIWINPTWSGSGNAGGVKVTIPEKQIDRVVPLNTKTYISELSMSSTSTTLPGTYNMHLSYAGTCQAIAAGTTSTLIGGASGFNFSDTFTVIYKAS